MTSVSLFKGRFEVVNFEPFKERAARLYNFLGEYFHSRGYEVREHETTITSVQDAISDTDTILVGHSRGASRILTELETTQSGRIERVVVFDPRSDCLERWRSLNLGKLMFASTLNQKQDYGLFEGVVWIDDEHYFERSFDRITKEMDVFLGK